MENEIIVKYFLILNFKFLLFLKERKESEIRI